MLAKSLMSALSVLAMTLASAAANAADNYKLDPAHSSVTFMIKHMDISYVHGRFNEFDANFTIDKDAPAKSTFALTIKANSVDTAVKGRDDHLRSPDFFNVKQYPLIQFQSTAVKPAKDGYEVSGDLNMHGVKKAITFTLQGGKTISFMGGQKIGLYGTLELNRNDFGVGGPKMAGMLGDTVHIHIGLEGAKSK